MECEEYLRRSRLFRRLRSGPQGQLVERYAARLVEDGLVRHVALPRLTDSRPTTRIHE